MGALLLIRTIFWFCITDCSGGN